MDRELILVRSVLVARSCSGALFYSAGLLEGQELREDKDGSGVGAAIIAAIAKS